MRTLLPDPSIYSCSQRIEVQCTACCRSTYCSIRHFQVIETALQPVRQGQCVKEYVNHLLLCGEALVTHAYPWQLYRWGERRLPQTSSKRWDQCVSSFTLASTDQPTPFRRRDGTVSSRNSILPAIGAGRHFTIDCQQGQCTTSYK
jgi:hypothetical protein